MKLTNPEAVETGRQLKFYNGKGKEYYAVYLGYREDAFLNYVSDLVNALMPQLKGGHWVSMPGVIFKMFDINEKVFSRIGDTMFIHKRRFRKYLRRCVTHARVTRS
jgi:hypothetical protein